MGDMVQGLSATVIGISIVMMVLLLLSFVLDLLKFLSVKPSANETGEVTTEETKKKVDNDLELVAVITAALAAHLQVPPDGLIVRSIRKSLPWNEAIRRDQQRRFY